jgi:hypothetical protein
MKKPKFLRFALLLPVVALIAGFATISSDYPKVTAKDEPTPSLKQPLQLARKSPKVTKEQRDILKNSKSPMFLSSGGMSDDSELTPSLSVSCDSCPIAVAGTHTADFTLTVERNGNTQVNDGRTLYLIPYVSNYNSFYISTSGQPDDHSEIYSPSSIEILFNPNLQLTDFASFSLGESEDSKQVTVTVDLYHNGNNYISFYIADDPIFPEFMGFASQTGTSTDLAAPGGSFTNGPYDSSDNLFIYTTDKQNNEDIYEILNLGYGTIKDESPGISSRTLCSAQETFCDYIADEDLTERTFTYTTEPGYSFYEWNIKTFTPAEPITGTETTITASTNDSLMLMIAETQLDTSNVYRFWSDRYRHHFYTDSANEKDHVINNLSHDWTYEGTAYKAAPYNGSCPVATTELYRFWSDNYRGHFYTASNSEKDYVIANLSHDWEYEGVAYCVGSSYTSDTPLNVYRFWSDNYRGHFYTASPTERDHVIYNLSHDWDYEGTVFYVSD